jgi:hypothetical protein
MAPVRTGTRQRWQVAACRADDPRQKDAIMSSAATSVTPFQPTTGGSVYVKPQDMAWQPTQFDGISIKVLYEDKEKAR